MFVYEYDDNQEKCNSRKSKQGMSIGPSTTRVTQMQEGGVLSYLIIRSVKCQVHLHWENRETYFVDFKPPETIARKI